MTQRISAKANMFQASTPSRRPSPATRSSGSRRCIRVSHELDVTWTIDGTAVPAAQQPQPRPVHLALSPGLHPLRATVVDPTEFVRDPAVRSSAAAHRDPYLDGRHQPADAAVGADAGRFTASTPTDHPVGADEVVYAETTQPDPSSRPSAGASTASRCRTRATTGTSTWAPSTSTGRHTLTAPAGAETLHLDRRRRRPRRLPTLSKPLLTVPKPTGPEYVYNAPFTMKLTASDDSAGYVVRGVPGQRRRLVQLLRLADRRGRAVPVHRRGHRHRPPGLRQAGCIPRGRPGTTSRPATAGTTIEYRAIDAPGNIGSPGRFVVTLLRPPPACTTTLTGVRNGPLRLTSGVTCLAGATINGPVTVAAGASLVATDSRIAGPVQASRAADVQLLRSRIDGPAQLTGTSRSVVLVGSRIAGPVVVAGSGTSEPAALAGNTISGPLSCSGNTPAPTNLGAPNNVAGPRTGQCRGL